MAGSLKTAVGAAGARIAAAPKRGRGRPTPDQAEAIAREITTAATDVFLADGYEGASMEAVAARAGVPKSTLYKRYPDKKALLRAVLRERIAAWALDERDVGLGVNLEQRLKSLAAEMLMRATSAEVSAFWRLVGNAWSGPHEVQERKDVIGYTEMLDRLVSEIRTYGPSSGVEAQDPRQVATALMAMLGGWVEFHAPDPGTADTDAVRFAHSAVDLILRGSAAW